MKTQEGYEVVNLTPYDVVTSIYMNTAFDDSKRESGFSGTVKDPNLDDRFICMEFCIWNANGELIYTNSKWGKRNNYKIEL